MVKKMLIGIGSVVAVVVIAAACSAHSSPSSTKNDPSAAAPASPTATATTTQTCGQKVESWLTAGGGQGYMNAVTKWLGKTGSAGQAGNVSALNHDGLKLAEASGIAAFHLPPGCVPGTRSAYHTAMIDFGRGGWQIVLGNYNTAASDISAGTRASNRATADIDRYAS